MPDWLQDKREGSKTGEEDWDDCVPTCQLLSSMIRDHGFKKLGKVTQKETGKKCIMLNGWLPWFCCMKLWVWGFQSAADKKVSHRQENALSSEWGNLWRARLTDSYCQSRDGWWRYSAFCGTLCQCMSRYVTGIWLSGEMDCRLKHLYADSVNTTEEQKVITSVSDWVQCQGLLRSPLPWPPLTLSQPQPPAICGCSSSVI